MRPPALTCTGCGAPLQPSSQFCELCGTDVRRPGGALAPTSRAAQLSVVLGFLGITMVPLVCSLGAVYCARRARRETAADPRLAGSTAALVGLTLGVTGICLALLLAALLAVPFVVH